MIAIPQKLLNEPFIDVLFHGTHCTILKKQLRQPLKNRQSYVSRHAVSVVLQGQQLIRAESGAVLQVNSGEMGLIPKGIYTVTDLLSETAGFQSYHLYLDDEMLERVLAMETHTANGVEESASFFSHALPPVLTHFFAAMEEMRKMVVAPSAALFQLKVLEFFALFASAEPESRIFQQLRAITTRPPGNLLEFMEEHFDKPLTVADYAYLTGRSLSTFGREFKTRFGLSPRKWIIRRRMEKARSILEQDLLVAEVALAVGYENLSHFIQAFKSHYGHTPGQTPHLQVR